jgi:hypothetical protein
MKRPLTLLLLCASATAITVPSLSQESPPLAGIAPAPIATESFDLYHNRIYLPVKVNGHDSIPMVVDTGAAVSGLSERSAEAFRLPHRGHAQLNGNGDVTSRISLAKDLTFTIGAATLPEKVVAVVPYTELENLEGRRIDGILGVEFFRRYVVVVDYPARTLSVYEPANYVYQGRGGETVPPTRR